MSLVNRMLTGLLITLALATAPAVVSAQAEPVSLSLKDAVELALKNNEKGQISREEINIAKASLMENISAAWPQITGIAGYTHNIEQPVTVFEMSALAPLFQAMQLPPPPDAEIPMVYKHDWNFTLNVTQNIYTFGRIYNAVRVADSYKKLSVTNDKIVNEDLEYEVQEVYYNLVLANKAVVIATENYNITKEHYSNVKAKYDSGLKSEFDLLQSKAEMAAARPNVIRAETAVILNQKLLASTCGLPMTQPINVTDDFQLFFPTQSVQEMKDIAYANRQEMQLMDHQIKMNKYTGNVFISNYLPILAAEMNYTWSGQSVTNEDDFWPEDDGTNWQNFWSVGVTFTWPFFDGLESYAQIRQYRSKERINRIQKVQLMKGIDLELTQLFQEFVSLKEQYTATQDSVVVAKKAFDLSKLRYDNGLGTALELDDARVMLLVAKSQSVQVLHSLNITRAKLDRALGKDALTNE